MSGRKSVKTYEGEIRKLVHMSVAALNPEGHQTLLYFCFLDKGSVS
jgi:hypothetical protein